MTEQVNRPHKWKISTLGHGETQCEWCFATNRELAVLGMLEHCDKAPEPEPVPVVVLEPSPEQMQLMRALRSIAATLGAYALNVAYGGELAPFELANLKMLAEQVGCTVTDKHLAYAATRQVLARMLKERHSQVERFGYTPDHDDHNPERLHQQVLERVTAMPSEFEEQNLLEAGTIIVAALEAIERKRVREALPFRCPLCNCTNDEISAAPCTRPNCPCVDM